MKIMASENDSDRRFAFDCVLSSRQVEQILARRFL